MMVNSHAFSALWFITILLLFRFDLIWFWVSQFHVFLFAIWELFPNFFVVLHLHRKSTSSFSKHAFFLFLLYLQVWCKCKSHWKKYILKKYKNWKQQKQPQPSYTGVCAWDRRQRHNKAKHNVLSWFSTFINRFEQRQNTEKKHENNREQIPTERESVRNEDSNQKESIRETVFKLVTLKI